MTMRTVLGRNAAAALIDNKYGWVLSLKNSRLVPPPGQPPGRELPGWDGRTDPRRQSASLTAKGKGPMPESQFQIPLAALELYHHYSLPATLTAPRLSHLIFQHRPTLARMETIPNGYLDR